MKCLTMIQEIRILEYILNENVHGDETWLVPEILQKGKSYKILEYKIQTLNYVNPIFSQFMQKAKYEEI